MRNELSDTALSEMREPTNGPRPSSVLAAAISAEMRTTALMPIRPQRSDAQMTTVTTM